MTFKSCLIPLHSWGLCFLSQLPPWVSIQPHPPGLSLPSVSFSLLAEPVPNIHRRSQSVTQKQRGFTVLSFLYTEIRITVVGIPVKCFLKDLRNDLFLILIYSWDELPSRQGWIFDPILRDNNNHPRWSSANHVPRGPKLCVHYLI